MTGAVIGEATSGPALGLILLYQLSCSSLLCCCSSQKGGEDGNTFFLRIPDPVISAFGMDGEGQNLLPTEDSHLTQNKPRFLARASRVLGTVAPADLPFSRCCDRRGPASGHLCWLSLLPGALCKPSLFMCLFKCLTETTPH